MKITNPADKNRHRMEILFNLAVNIKRAGYIFFTVIAFLFFAGQFVCAGGDLSIPVSKDRDILSPEVYATLNGVAQIKEKQQRYVAKMNEAQCPDSENLICRYNLDGSFTLTDKQEGIVTHFDKNKRLLSITNTEIGQVTEFNAEEKIKRIKEADGSRAEYLYDTEGEILDVIEYDKDGEIKKQNEEITETMDALKETEALLREKEEKKEDLIIEGNNEENIKSKIGENIIEKALSAIKEMFVAAADAFVKIGDWLRTQADNVINCAAKALQIVTSTKSYPDGHRQVTSEEKIAEETLLIDILRGVITEETTGRLQTSMYAMKEAAQEHGIDLTGAKLTYQDLQDIYTLSATRYPLTVICHLTAGHYIVITNVTGETVTCVDSGAGEVTIDKAVFVSRWSGNVLLYEDAVLPAMRPLRLTDDRIEQIKGSGVLYAYDFDDGSSAEENGFTVQTTPAESSHALAGKTLIFDIEVLEINAAEEGPEVVKAGDYIGVKYTGYLEDGSVFDSNEGSEELFCFTVGSGQVIEGFDEAVIGLGIGDEVTVTIPPELGYGFEGTDVEVEEDAEYGGYSLKIYGNDIHDSLTSVEKEFVLDTECEVNFCWKVSSEDSYDYLKFYIDGVQQAEICGQTEWEYKTYALAEGTRTLRWEYQKDSSTSGGLDAGWVDDISISVNDAEDEEDDFDWDDFFKDLMAENGDSAENSQDSSALDLNSIVSSSAEESKTWVPDNFDGVTMNIPLQKRTRSFVPEELQLKPKKSLYFADAARVKNNKNKKETALYDYSFNDGSSLENNGFVVGGSADKGNASVYVDPQTAYNNKGYSVKFDGKNNRGKVVYVEKAVNLKEKGELDFLWKISSVENGACLEFYIDEVKQDEISGEKDWENKKYDLPAGEHVLRWEYVKNTDFSEDAGWIDEVVIKMTKGVSAVVEKISSRKAESVKAQNAKSGRQTKK